ncbi:MAG: ATP-binding protein, partial [Pseudomonadota bacterium]
FTRQGMVKLSAETCDETGELKIAVSDTGIGISAEEQDRVFEAFHQVDNATTREFSGTGLGLSICQNLAAALGGRIEVESVVNEGSTFRLVLPLNAVELGAEASNTGAASLSECRVALVEANTMKQAILVGLIEPHVKSVLPVTNAKDCESAIASGLVDHIVLDAMSAAAGTDPIDRLLAQTKPRSERRSSMRPAKICQSMPFRRCLTLSCC